MKAIVIFAAFLAVGNAWVILPPLNPGQRPLPPGISPEVPVLPPKPILPGPLPPMMPSDVESHVLNFPSDEDPQIRVHVNIKQEQAPPAGHRPELNQPRHRRSLLPPTNGPRPQPGVEWGPNPIFPEIGNKPEIPGNKPEIGWGPPQLPEIPSVPVPPCNLPEVQPPPTNPEMPVLPVPELPDKPMVFIYPNAQHQLVKLRVQYNEQHGQIILPIPGPSPYKLEWNPMPGNKPSPGFPSIDPIFPEFPGGPGNLPEVGPEQPIIPMPPPVVGGGKVPQVELFLDIGEQENY